MRRRVLSIARVEGTHLHMKVVGGKIGVGAGQPLGIEGGLDLEYLLRRDSIPTPLGQRRRHSRRLMRR